MQGEILNNASELTEIKKRIKRDTKKLKEVEMILLILMKKGSCTRIEYRKTGKVRNIITKSKRSSDASRKNQTNS